MADVFVSETETESDTVGTTSISDPDATDQKEATCTRKNM